MTFTVVVLWLSGMLLGGIGAFVLAWALFADRFRGEHGRRRCRRCWYEMTGVAGLQCPECGRVARDERHLHATRRYWRRGVSGLLVLLAGIGCGWYASGLLLGWRSVAPAAIALRLAPVIGRDAALRAVVGQGTSGWPVTALESDFSDWTFGAMERLAIDILKDDKAPFSEVHAAVDSLQWMREHITRRDEVARLLVNVVPSRMMPLMTWSTLTYWLIAQPGVAVPVDEILAAAAKYGTDGHGLASEFISRGLTPEKAAAVPDLLTQGTVYGVTWPELGQASPEVKSILFKRCREVYFAGDDEVKKRISRFIWPNARFIEAGNPDVEAMAREQIERFTRGESCEFLDMNSFILWQASEALSGLLLEIAGMLSSTSPEARKRASGILNNVKTIDGRSVILTNALCDVVKSGTDAGRERAIDLVQRQPAIDRHQMVDAAIAGLDTVVTPQALTRLLQFVTDVANDASSASAVERERVERVERALQRTLEKGGPLASVAATWIGRLLHPSDASIALLRSAATRTETDPAARIEARNALLHIRDRASPRIDPLTPLELAAPK